MRECIKKFYLPSCAAIIAVGLYTGDVRAEHSDIEFSYEGGKIEFTPGGEGLVFEGDFPTSGLFERFTTDPGFLSETVEGLGILPGDIVSYNILGVLVFWSAATEGFANPEAATITIENGVGPDTLVSGSSGEISPGGVIGQAGGGGDFHSHVGFTLSAGAATGAYGLLMELDTATAGIANSDPYYIVFNFGLDEEGNNPLVPDFEDAVEAFRGHLVPEPSSFALCAAGCVLLGIGAWRHQREESVRCAL